MMLVSFYLRPDCTIFEGKKQMNNMFVVMNIIAQISLGMVHSVAAQINPDDFVFPLEKSAISSVCTFQNGTNGQCINASECPNVQEEYIINGVNPTLCYFAKNEPVVCCVMETMKLFHPWLNEWATNTPATKESSETIQKPEELNVRPIVPSEQLVQRRKSVISCEDNYSKAVPFKVNPDHFHITIVGGQVTSEGEFPHMAALGWTNEGNKINWRCGGTLISHDYVMTAAHCTVGRTPPDIIRIGAKDLVNVDTLYEPQDFGVEKIIPHPYYRATQLYHDIALIKLNQSAETTIKVRPACLWQTSIINFTDATATGYGNTEFGGQSSNELLKVDLKLVSNKECSEEYKSDGSLENGITESQLCAGDSAGEKDTCQGDSGGPIQVSTMNERQLVYHIVGVTSFGKACATTLPGVYTRVSYYLDWIESIVWE